MGFYDVTCALSGVMLMGLPRSVVLVVGESDTGWGAVSPPIRGIYNRLGTLDFKERPDPEVERWAREMLDARTRGRLTAPDEYWDMAEQSAADAYPPPAPGAEDTCSLLHLFDRVMVHSAIDGFPAEPVRLDGRALGYNFISAPIFDAIASQSPDVAPAEAVIAWSRQRGTPIGPVRMTDIGSTRCARSRRVWRPHARGSRTFRGSCPSSSN